MTGSTYVGGTATSSSGATSLSPGLPSGYRAGDLFVAITMISTGAAGAFSASGWTSQAHYADGGTYAQGTVDVLYKVAASSSETAPTFTQNTGAAPYCSVLVLCFRGAAGTAPIRSSNRTGYTSAAASFVAPALTAGAHDALVVCDMSFTNSPGVSVAPASMSAGAVTASPSPASSYYQLDLSAGDTGTRTSAMSGAAKGSAVSLLIKSANTAPNAPALTSPANNATLDRGITQRFAWTFSDPDPGDSQSKFDLQYRTVGASTWTSVTGTTPNAYWDAAAGTFAAGNYEWQVRAYDSQGVQGPWSASGFFTAADGNDAPTITAPVSGSTVSSTATVIWSTPSQTDYQVRRVADDGSGNPNANTVYYDSGDVASASTRSVDLTFDTNNRYEHIQVRYKLNGLWSSWASIRVRVSYTAPAAPTFTVDLDAASGSALVTITNPAPGTGQPSVAYNVVEADDGDGKGFSTRPGSSQVTPNTAWRYWTPPSGFDPAGNVRVTAVATNGVTASTTSPLNVTDGNSPANTTTTISDGGVVL